MDLAKLQLLKDHEKSCLIFQGDVLIYSANFIGVKPLLQFMETLNGVHPPKDLILVDKVIGKAALLLAVYLGIREIYTPVTSEAALEAATFHQVNLYSETRVPYILNRTQDALCPLEQSVVETMDPKEALLNINAAIKILMAKKPSS